MIVNDLDDWDDIDCLDRRLRQKGLPKAIQEIITAIPVIENKFGLDTAEVEKIRRNLICKSLWIGSLFGQKNSEKKEGKVRRSTKGLFTG